MAGSSGRGYVPQRRSTKPNFNDSDVNECLKELLRAYNERDTDAIRRHLGVLRDSLEIRDDDLIRTLFGGSESKHTAVHGLSDVDVLMIINDSSLSGQSPSAVINAMAERIRQRLPFTNVQTGDLAVTVKFSDGVEMQILPAIRTNSGVRIADPGANRWSNVIYPEKFARKLTQVNQAHGGQVIPTVKLGKALMAHNIRSERDKISGYHLESLAIEAFRNYRGSRDPKEMLHHFLKFSSDRVMEPITDSTGQSRHVDSDMGSTGSDRRRRVADTFRKIQRRLDSCQTKAELKNMFGD